MFTHDRRSGWFIGVILIVVGAFFLARNAGLLREIPWDYIWPVLLIVVGLAFILGRRG